MRFSWTGLAPLLVPLMLSAALLSFFQGDRPVLLFLILLVPSCVVRFSVSEDTCRAQDHRFGFRHDCHADRKRTRFCRPSFYRFQVVGSVPRRDGPSRFLS